MSGWAGLSAPLDPKTIAGEADIGAVLGDTLALLQEASAYLKRLPQVHPTLVLIAKLERHLQAPAMATVQRAADRVRHEQQARCATANDPYGVPIIEAEVQGDKMRLKLGTPRNRERAINLLQAGCEMHLVLKSVQR